MRKKLKCILLIDDNEADNFFSEMIIEKANCAERVIAVKSGQLALDHLTSKNRQKHPRPELIFLDINMPAMNGWEFLEEYKELAPEQQTQVVVVMLTTSLNPDDKKKADGIKDIKQFVNKPLSVRSLTEILEKYF